MPRKPPSASTRRVTRSHSRASSEIGNGTTTKETAESVGGAKAELTYYTQLRNPSDTSSYEKGKRSF